MSEDVDKEFHILPMPPVPAEAWQFIEEAQIAMERASGSREVVITGHVKEEHHQHGKNFAK